MTGLLGVSKDTSEIFFGGEGSNFYAVLMLLEILVVHSGYLIPPVPLEN